MGFINKSWQRNLSSNLVNAGERVAGSIAARALINKFAPNKGANATNTEKTIYNLGGPVALFVSAALDVVASNENIRCLAQGMTTAAAEHTLAVIAPSFAQNFGLSGVEDVNAENAALMGGCGNVGALSAGDAAEEALKEVPAAQIQNDGNPWPEIAEKIDDPNTTVKVEGIEETDAELMGEEIEDAELMGMF